jgi:hypothetical protein
MAVKYLVVLNGKELIAVARGNLIQELVFGQNRKDVPVSVQNPSFWVQKKEDAPSSEHILIL